jgi:hypothetical protein
MNGTLYYLQAVDEPADEAAGWRLAGARALCVNADDAMHQLVAARRTAAMIVLSPGFAAQLPATELDAALAALQPLTVILPFEPLLPADPAERARRQLGLESETA